MDERECLKESIADLQHEIWTEEIENLFRVSYHIDDGSVWIPVKKVEHYKKLIKTPYYKLSEEEKDNVREQADKILELL